MTPGRENFWIRIVIAFILFEFLLCFGFFCWFFVLVFAFGCLPFAILVPKIPDEVPENFSE